MDGRGAVDAFTAFSMAMQGYPLTRAPAAMQKTAARPNGGERRADAPEAVANRLGVERARGWRHHANCDCGRTT